MTWLTCAAYHSRGAGQVISEKDRCPQCRGNKTVQDKKILEVNVERGMQHNQKIVFRGEADEAVRQVAPTCTLRPLTPLAPPTACSRTLSLATSSLSFSRRSTRSSSAKVRVVSRCPTPCNACR